MAKKQNKSTAASGAGTGQAQRLGILGRRGAEKQPKPGNLPESSAA